MKTALITGGARGLGHGFCKYLLAGGWKVFVGCRDVGRVPADILGPNAVPVTVDVASDESIAQAYATVATHTDKLHLLINNAGLNKDSATNNNKKIVCNLQDLSRTALLRMFDINAIAPMMVLKQFLPLLTASPSFVVNISSARASYHDEFEKTNGNYGYTASKAALNMMTYDSTLFDIPANIQTFCVHPGGVKTDMNPSGTDDPVAQAQKIVEITQNWRPEFNGKFLRYSGEYYPL